MSRARVEGAPAWRRQLRVPRGLLGSIFGHLMTFTNRRINRMALELAGVEPGDHVLEIGFGPGKTIEALSRRAHQGFVAGIDPSEAMLRQARRRNAAALDRGRVDLRRGSISHIPFGDGAFHKVLTINTLFFWPEPESDLREVRRVLEEEGQLVICFRKKEPPAEGRQGDDPRALWGTSIGQVEEMLDTAGFRDIRRTVRNDPTIAWNLTTSSGSYGSESVGVCATA